MFNKLSNKFRSMMRGFLRDEEGAAYQLGFTMVLPIYALLIVFILELGLLLSVKMAVTHATHAAARAAVVWMPVEDRELSEEARKGMVYVAFVNAMAPTASSRHGSTSGRYFRYPNDAPQAWASAYTQYSKGGHEHDYLSKKWRYAAAASRVRVEKDTDAFDSAITVTVEYEHPFHTAGAGWLLGRTSSWAGLPHRTRTVSATVTMDQEGYRNDEQELGINFHADHGFSGETY